MGRFAIREPEEAGKAWPAIVIGLFVAFGEVLFGYDTGTISGILAMDYWQTLFSTGYVNTQGHLDVSPSQSSAIVSILFAGTFFGAHEDDKCIKMRPRDCIFQVGLIYEELKSWLSKSLWPTERPLSIRPTKDVAIRIPHFPLSNAQVINHISITFNGSCRSVF
ncbi:hypothetical protein F4820DRAFT_401231 [Hypoxylon rubiginosum]|uniref:Uncharacterized protein n=1 Tax=Hypoxylon rubiginosum TaxID=110542 RepID=A0ACB9ZHK5_9PEZI|nr:hypothetical protein F4820DRAFT_401231 [Hypoxylon rubiginosum]